MFNFEKMRAIRCTIPNCRCECFSPGKTLLRTCETCKHGWVAHALDKLGYRSMYQLGMQVEIVQPNIVFDIASLMLYGAQATPIRLKILLDRLFSVLQHDEVLQVLHGFGWSYEDYARGYILQVKDPAGRVLDKWTVATRDEEQVILQQFLRFGETKSIAQEIILQDTRENREKQVVNTPKTESEIKKFIERSNMSMQSFMRSYEARHLIGRPPLSTYPPQSSSSSSSSTRMLSPSVLQRYSPSSREPPPIGMPLQNSSPLSGSPLTRLQTMQPFDYRREHLSPTISPVTSEKSLPRSTETKSPENLSLGGGASVSSASTPPGSTSSATPLTVPVVTPLKKEITEDYKYTLISGIPENLNLQQDADGAIDYSTKVSPSSSSASSNMSCMSSTSVFADRKVKHLRKSANPMKRNWQPNPAFGSTLISPSGKKRVLCTACNKTFCDKGALKIHYSAVHLKEMHKCTVEGCNMMFSSRRSRNRHSANPNPKLHMPNAKRKIPEGATVIDEKKLPTSLSTTLPSSLLSVPTTAAITAITGISQDMKAVIPKMEPEFYPEGHLLSPSRPYYLDPNSHLSSMLPSPAKFPKMELQAENLSLSSEAKKELMSTRSVSKRKSMVPTRCTQTEEVFVMSDENSNEGMPSVDGSSDMDSSMVAENLSISRVSEDESKESDCSKDEEEAAGLELVDEDSNCSSNKLDTESNNDNQKNSESKKKKVPTATLR